jgi:NAD(P)-dependent dehydrogenase (short-subunit alcohol dehydrogenase family)
MLTRSKERAAEAISKIKTACEGIGNQVGSIEFVHMDLADFATIKLAAKEVIRQEGPDGRLDVLFGNAGTGGRKNAPPGRQGYEYHITINSMGNFVLTRLLMPLLAQTAKKLPPGSVRVAWPASILVKLNAPKTGFRPEWLRDHATARNCTHYVELYSASKTGSWFLTFEFACRHQKDSGVIHIAGNPGTYNTNMW